MPSSVIGFPVTGVLKTTFISLDDTPASLGTAGQVLAVNTAADGMEWIDPPSGGGSGGATSLDGLSDVDLSTNAPTSGQFLSYNGTSWVPVAAPSGGATTMDGLTDVSAASPADGQMLAWNAANTRWELVAAPTGGTIATLNAIANVNTPNPTDGQILSWDNANNQWVAIDAPSGGSGGASTIEEIAGIEVNRSVDMSMAKNGLPLVWDQASNAFVVQNPASISSIVLGGGEELIYSVADMNNWSAITLDVATHGLDKYDEILIIATNMNTRFRLALSADGGATNISGPWSGTGGSNIIGGASTDYASVGGDADNQSASWGYVCIQNFNNSYAPAYYRTHGGANGSSDRRELEWAANSTARVNAIKLWPGTSFSSGKLYVIGRKISRQPILSKFNATYATSLAASTEILGKDFPLSTKYRQGNIGKVILENAASGTETFNLKENSTVIATGTISTGESSCNLIASVNYTATGVLSLEWVNSGSSAPGDIFATVRGEASE